MINGSVDGVITYLQNENNINMGSCECELSKLSSIALTALFYPLFQNLHNFHLTVLNVD